MRTLGDLNESCERPIPSQKYIHDVPKRLINPGLGDPFLRTTKWYVSGDALNPR